LTEGGIRSCIVKRVDRRLKLIRLQSRRQHAPQKKISQHPNPEIRVSKSKIHTGAGFQACPLAMMTETPKRQAKRPAPTNGLSVSLKRFEKSASTGGHSGPHLHGGFVVEQAFRISNQVL
jgi:hypothetical protein